MKKSFSATGRNGTFSGEVEVILNAEARTRTVNNRITHDDETIKYYVHKIKGRAGGKDLPESETEQEDKVPELVMSMEKQVMHLLEWQSDREETQTVNKILKNRGYN